MGLARFSVVACLGLLIASVAASGSGESAPGQDAGSVATGQVDQFRSAPFLKPIMVSGTQPVFGEWHANVLPNGNMIVGWIDVKSGVGCGFTTSTDSGKTWSPPSVMEASANSGGDPVITVDADGTVYRSCILTPKKGGGDGTWYEKSTDGGLTWDTTTKRAVQPFDDYQWAATDKGTIWQIYNNGDAGMRVSTDGGETWGSSKTVSDGWPSCIQYTDGVIYGFSGQEGQTMMFYKSADRGATWTKKAVLNVKGGSRGECVYDAVRKDLWFVWAQGGFGNTGQGPSTAVQVLHSSDFGGTFDQPVVVHDPKASSDFASIGVDVSGGLHVAWMDKSGGFAQAFYSNSTDKGKTWSAALKVSDHTSASGAQYIHYGKGLVVTPSGTVCFSYPAPGSTSSSTSMFVTCGEAASKGVDHVGVSPATATITADQTQQFTATAYDANNNPLQGITFAWAATDGTVSASGLFTPQKVGSHTVSATAQGKGGTAQVTVTAGAAVSVAISPPTATVPADKTQLFTASGQDAKGNPVTLFSWIASGGSVSQAGLYTPDTVGQYQVTASSGGKNAVAQVQVVPGALAMIHVEPDAVTVRADRTQQYNAKGMDSKGNDVPVSPSWTAGIGEMSASGLFTPEKVGTWKVTATQGGITDTVDVNVVPGAIAKLDITPKSSTLDKGQQVSFQLAAEDSKGNEIPMSEAEVEWSVVGGGAGTVDATGVFTAEFPGSVTVRATSIYLGESKSADAKVMVHWWMLYLLLIALAAMSVIGVGAARRRKKKREAAMRATQWQGESWQNEQWPQGKAGAAGQWPPPGPAF